MTFYLNKRLSQSLTEHVTVQLDNGQIFFFVYYIFILFIFRQFTKVNFLHFSLKVTTHRLSHSNGSLSLRMNSALTPTLYDLV